MTLYVVAMYYSVATLCHHVARVYTVSLCSYTAYIVSQCSYSVATLCHYVATVSPCSDSVHSVTMHIATAVHTVTLCNIATAVYTMSLCSYLTTEVHTVPLCM